jgi:hypothetical protein
MEWCEMAPFLILKFLPISHNFNYALSESTNTQSITVGDQRRAILIGFFTHWLMNQKFLPLLKNQGWNQMI